MPARTRTSPTSAPRRRSSATGSDPAGRVSAVEIGIEPPQLGRRIIALFRPQRRALIVIVAMVIATSISSVISALLVRQGFNKALFVRGGPDLGALYPLVAALIAIPILAGVLNVAQTYLTEVVGNRVLQDLRDRLFAHLEQLSLAFYTSTRSGEVQSRLANDVGGVQETITSTASSVLSNVVTLVSSVVAMLLLSPLLTLISLAVAPVFVIFSRRVGGARRSARREAQASLATMGSITQETLSVSGILLAKVFGRQSHEVERYRAENSNQAGLQIRQAMVGRSFFAVTQAFFGISPALVYLVAGLQGGSALSAGTLVAFTTLQSRLLMPINQLLQVSVDVQSSLGGTVRDNLSYGRPDATEEQIVAAAKAAFIHDRILALDHGYDTVVGERGYRFSGGERQRLAIARVILEDPPILILDEATSALDTESERVVQQALESLMTRRTTIAIAHRLSTIRSADVIFALQDGRIVERGSHDELLARGGLYARLYTEQFGDGAIEAHCADGVILGNGRPCKPSARHRDHAEDAVRVAAASAHPEPVAELPADLRAALRA
jgi:ABC-type multidrug transport system fused ATPase/permease subunit